jgi:hypothetical protein
MLNFELHVLSRGSPLVAQVTATPKDQMWQLRLELEGRSYSAEGWDCLDAFNKIRRDLEDSHSFLCNGARPNFLLSPMASQAGGLQGYLVPDERKARLSDLVPIFGAAPVEEIGSVFDQTEFKKRYMDLVQSGRLPD